MDTPSQTIEQETTVQPVHEAGPEPMALFAIDPGLAIWTWITFFAVLLIMKKFVFPNLLQGMADREQEIASALDNAERVRKQLAAVENERQTILKQARSEADEMIAAVREDVKKLRKELIRDAEKEAADVVAHTRLKLEEERAVALSSLRAELAEAVCETASKLVQRSYNSQEDAALARQLVEQL